MGKGVIPKPKGVRCQFITQNSILHPVWPIGTPTTPITVFCFYLHLYILAFHIPHASLVYTCRTWASLSLSTIIEHACAHRSNSCQYSHETRLVSEIHLNFNDGYLLILENHTNSNTVLHVKHVVTDTYSCSYASRYLYNYLCVCRVVSRCLSFIYFRLFNNSILSIDGLENSSLQSGN